MMEAEEIPKNATIRQEYIKCSNPDCKELHKPHGPYLYAYWKQDKKLKKKYIGRSWDDWVNRMLARRSLTRPSDIRKTKFINEQIKKGNNLAKEYKLKLKLDRVTLDWAYKQIVNDISERRILKMIHLAEKYNFEFQGEVNDLVAFVADKMRSKGLDPMDIEAMDSYLNTEFM